MTQQQLARLTQLIAAGNTDAFYHWTAWERLRDNVLALDHYECQMCKARGRYSRAVVVHHVKHLRDRPELALSIWDGHTRQLVSLCKACHELCHPEPNSLGLGFFDRGYLYRPILLLKEKFLL